MLSAPPAGMAPVTQAMHAYRDAVIRFGSDSARLDPYKRSLVNKSLQLVKEKQDHNDLYAATRVLHEVLACLPDNSRLLEMSKKLELTRQRQLRQSQDSLLIAETRYRLALQRHLQAQEHLSPPSIVRDWRGRLTGERLANIAAQLKVCAQRELDYESLPLASQCIALAEQLRGKKFIDSELKRLDQLMRSKGARVHPISVTEHDDELRRSLSEALKRGDLVNARRLLDILAEREVSDPRLDDLEKTVRTAIDTKISSLRRQADDSYRQQHYREARATWLEILQLDPWDADAKALIRRVDNIIRNLDTLRKQQRSK